MTFVGADNVIFTFNGKHQQPYRQHRVIDTDVAEPSDRYKYPDAYIFKYIYIDIL